MTNFFDHPILKKINQLNLPKNQYVIFGSGPMYAHNLLKLKKSDIDIIVTKKLWNSLIKIHKTIITQFGDQKISLFNDKIEIYPHWYPEIGNPKLKQIHPLPIWTTKHLIKSAQTIQNLPFAKLEYVLDYKIRINRPKDQKHIKILQDYLKA